MSLIAGAVALVILLEVLRTMEKTTAHRTDNDAHCEKRLQILREDLPGSKTENMTRTKVLHDDYFVLHPLRP